MYRIRMKRGFATILKNEKEIEPLSGLLVVGGELKELQELVNLANQAAAQQSVHTAPPSACEDCGSVDEHIHYANCPLANTAGR